MIETVYLVFFSSNLMEGEFSPLHYAHLSLEGAKKLVDGRTGQTNVWEAHTGHGRCWIARPKGDYLGQTFSVSEHPVLP